MIAYAEKGDSFSNAVNKVKHQLKHENDYLDLEFNEIRVRVSKNSLLADLCTIYDLKHEIRRLQFKIN